MTLFVTGSNGREQSPHLDLNPSLSVQNMRKTSAYTLAQLSNNMVRNLLTPCKIPGADTKDDNDSVITFIEVLHYQSNRL